MKKIINFFIIVFLIMTFCSCGKDSNIKSDSVTVVTREEGSGTRIAFKDLVGISDKNGNDIITDNAEVTNSTSVMIYTIMGNRNAIGYLSLGSLSNEVKAVSVDGVKAYSKNIETGKYKISRAFYVCAKKNSVSEIASDFVAYVLSDEGQKIVKEKGYIKVTDGKPYSASPIKGKIVLAGSTSVSPLIEILADKYKKINPNVQIEIQQTGSSAGISSAISGICNLGLSSRELTESEKKELDYKEIALDGIVVVVNNNNKVDNLSIKNIKNLFDGSIKKWSEIK